MPEDQLTRAERVRLEALSQALGMSAHVCAARPTEEDVLARAERIEKWLKAADLSEN